MTPERVQEIMTELHNAGYAIVIFTPEELDGAPYTKVEDNMIERGWEAIEVLK